ncbi:MAG: hypothetical protein PsegKO_34300 [Pseudohongiellaceae bacterium]
MLSASGNTLQNGPASVLAFRRDSRLTCKWTDWIGIPNDGTLFRKQLKVLAPAGTDRNIMSLSKVLASLITILASSALLAIAGSQGSVEVAGLPLYALCAGVGFVLHWLAFVPAYLFQTERYFDLIGGVSFLGTVALAAVLHPDMSMRGWLLCLLVAIWAARLGIFLFRRIHKSGGDSRFDDMKSKFWRFLLAWTLAGAWVFITLAAALSAITRADHSPVGIFAVVGTAVWLIGFVLEVVADYQKSLFRADPKNADKFIASGLWAYSRHPNYFGEIVLWTGVAIIVLPVLQGWQWLTLVSPVFVALLLTRVSGVPMLEASARKRWGGDPEYQHYVEQTPVLIPRPV